MKLESPKNTNYSAVVIRVNHVVDLPGLDNLVGVPALGHQALTQKGKSVGDLVIAFTAETQLSEEFCHHNNLYRDVELNKDDETGYLEKNRRVRALKLRGHRSDALLMPLSSIEFTGARWWELEEGDTFDQVNGHEICRKYVVPVKPGAQSAGDKKLKKAFKRVDTKLFPEHLDTDNYFRSAHLLDTTREVVVTQKLHGTSIRVGRVPVLRQKKWFEKFVNRWLPTPDHEYDAVFGSRKVIKDVNNSASGYYASDIWTQYGKEIADLIPEGYILYGELVGFTPDGSPIQKNYTYEAKDKEAHLYVYRVATINAQGTLADLPWDGVKQFCLERGLKWVPELDRISGGEDQKEQIQEFLDTYLDQRFADFGDWIEPPVIVSSHKTVDEGFCLRQERTVPTILKAKSAKFLEHETKLLDSGEADLESVA